MSIMFKRFLAYFFDLMAVSLVTMAFSVSPLNPNYEETQKLENEYMERYKEFNEINQDEISNEEYEEYVKNFNLYATDVTYNTRKLGIYEDGCTIIILILYFGIFAYFFEGETVGKRLLKLKIVDKDGHKPKLWQLITRTIILFGIPLVIIDSIGAHIFGMMNYTYINIVIYLLNMALSIAILITLFVTKDNRGLHDIIAKTTVVERK